MPLRELGRLENGQLPAYQALCAMLEVYGVPVSEWGSYLERCERDRERGWWRGYSLKDSTYVRLEDEASTMIEFQLGRVPWLLQTERYARAARPRRSPGRESSVVEEANPAVLISRQKRLFGDNPLALHAVVHEPGIREADHVQLVQLVERAQLPNVTVQIVPRSVPLPPGSCGSMILLRFDERHERDIAYTQTMFGLAQHHDEDDVAAVRRTLVQLAEEALSPEESLLSLKGMLTTI